jgi:hypothetical protein
MCGVLWKPVLGNVDFYTGAESNFFSKLLIYSILVCLVRVLLSSMQK